MTEPLDYESLGTFVSIYGLVPIVVLRPDWAKDVPDDDWQMIVDHIRLFAMESMKEPPPNFFRNKAHASMRGEPF